MESEGWEVVQYSDVVSKNDGDKQSYNYRHYELKGKMVSSITMSLRSMGTNLKYSIEELGSCSLTQLVKNTRGPLYLYGNELSNNDPDAHNKLRAYIDGTLWFSYRKRFPSLRSVKNFNYTSDASNIKRLGLHSKSSANVSLPHTFFKHLQNV